MDEDEPIPSLASRRGFLGLAVLAVLIATLRPMHIDEATPRPFFELGAWDSVDVLENVLLFVPLGISLGLLGIGGGPALLLSAALSLSVEVAQLGIPGRTTNAWDVFANVLGGAAGMAAAHSRWRAFVLAEIRRDMETPVSGAPPDADLVAAYAFEEGAGRAVQDSSGHGHTGTIHAATWTEQGKSGRALVFDGVGSMVTIPPSPTLELEEAMTLSAWVLPKPGMKGWRQVLKKEVDAYYLTASSDAGPLRPAGGGTFGSISESVAAPRSIAVNTWGHLALTYDGCSLALYTDGILVAERTLWYPGRLLSVALDAESLAPGALPDSLGFSERLLAGGVLRVSVEASRQPVRRR